MQVCQSVAHTDATGGNQPSRQNPEQERNAATHHYTKEILLRDLSLRVFVNLHEPLRIRPDGDDQASRTRELLHERRRYRPRRRANMNRVVRPLRSVPYPATAT